MLDNKHIKYKSCINKLDDLFFLQTKVYDNENDNSNVYRTDQDGSIMFKIKNDKLIVETCTP